MALSPVYVQMFADRFDIDYQAHRKLANTVKEVHGVVGDAYKEKLMAQVDMAQHGAYGADIPATAVSATAPSTTFTDYDLKLVLDHFESLNINANVVSAYSEDHAAAMGRREDQYIIDSVVAAATKSVSVGSSNLTIDKLIAANALLGLDEVMGKKHLVIHANNLRGLMKDTSHQIGSSDYNQVRALVNGEINFYMGFFFHVLGTRTMNGVAEGLPITGNNRTCIAYAEKAATMAYRLDPQVKMVEVPENFRVETLSLLSAGCVVGRPKGVCTIICDESAS